LDRAENSICRRKERSRWQSLLSIKQKVSGSCVPLILDIILYRRSSRAICQGNDFIEPTVFCSSREEAWNPRTGMGFFQLREHGIRISAIAGFIHNLVGFAYSFYRLASRFPCLPDPSNR